jgi:adenylate kinase
MNRLEAAGILQHGERVRQAVSRILREDIMSNKNDRAAWIKGDDAHCAVRPRAQEKPFRFVLLGAPGVGKGTQAELICERLGTCHLSTGDVFRTARALAPAERSPALEEALNLMHRGELVPDLTVLNLVLERVRCLRCAGGFLLDGFPRTVVQAEALSFMLDQDKVKLTAVLNYELPLAKVVARLSGRRTCPGCKAVFHVSARPPRVAGVCDHCGASLYQRDDDRPDSIRTRMEVYEKSTKPLIDYYSQLGTLVTISAEGTPEDIYQRTLDALNGTLSETVLTGAAAG